MNFLIQILLGAALSLLAAFLTPRPKQPKVEVKDLEDPTAEAGREIPVVFGTITAADPNIIGFWDKKTTTKQVKA